MMMVIMPTPLFLPWASWRWLLLLMDTKEAMEKWQGGCCRKKSGAPLLLCCEQEVQECSRVAEW